MLTIDNQTLNKYSVRAEKLTDAVEKKATETIKKYVSASYPIVLSVPSGKGSNGYGTAVLKDAMEKALGVDILFNVKDKEGNK